MDDTRIEQRIGIQATSDRIWDLIADLQSWAGWNPHDQGVEGRIAFGGTLAMTESWPGAPERRAEGRVAEWEPLARLAWVENRGFLFRTLRYLEIDQLAPGSCIVASGIRFYGLRGEMFHDKHRAALRKGHAAVVEGLKSAAEG